MLCCGESAPSQQFVPTLCTSGTTSANGSVLRPCSARNRVTDRQALRQLCMFVDGGIDPRQSTREIREIAERPSSMGRRRSSAQVTAMFAPPQTVTNRAGRRPIATTVAPSERPVRRCGGAVVSDVPQRHRQPGPCRGGRCRTVASPAEASQDAGETPVGVVTSVDGGAASAWEASTAQEAGPTRCRHQPRR